MQSDFDAEGSDGDYALHALVKQGRLEELAVLLANKADVNQVDPRDRQGVMPLHVAAEVGSAEAVELLIAAGAELDALTTTSHGEGLTTKETVLCKLPRISGTGEWQSCF